jgi:type IV secretion system protein VirB9
MKRPALIAAFWLLAAAPLQAAVEPHAGTGDPRLRVVTYDPTEVVAVHGVLGYQMLIEFDPAEKIENVAIGDSVGWQVVPSRRANLLFLKPMERAPATNMEVVTNLRRYAFELDVERSRGAARGRGVVYSLRFDYPAPVVPVIERPGPPPPPQDVNHAYSYEGATANVPSRVFDDGHATYFLFREGEEYPAIFALDADKGEAVVNSSIHDGYIVVDRLARGFVLRRGKDVTHIFNDGFREAQPGPLSPQPRQKARWFQ